MIVYVILAILIIGFVGFVFVAAGIEAFMKSIDS